MQNFLELKCLADDVDALSMFINASFLNIISFDEVDRGLGHEKKKHFVRYNLFFKENYYR